MGTFLSNKHHDVDPVWHVQLTVLVAILLQYFLPKEFLASPRHFTTIASLLALLALEFTTPRKPVFESLQRRINVLLVAASIGLTNLYSLVRVVEALLNGSISNGRQLIFAGINIYITNIIVFAVLYWEMDGGGPGTRKIAQAPQRDFLFPQDNLHEPAKHPWNPTFVDYLYVSSTNATAFSPTDTLPLSRRVKLLMLAQSLVSLITIALIAGRAVNILK